LRRSASSARRSAACACCAVRQACAAAASALSVAAGLAQIGRAALGGDRPRDAAAARRAEHASRISERDTCTKFRRKVANLKAYDRSRMIERSHAPRAAALQPSSAAARGRRGRPAAAEGGARAVRRRGRARVAGGALSRRGRRRHLGLVDFDVVDFSNLQRQIIHGTRDVGRSKLESAQARIEALNPEVRVETFDAHFSVRTRRRWSRRST
jgi:hypothetical protein